MAGSRVVIIGGGFAGTQCARVLRKHLSPQRCEIVLFNPENHMVFHPLLPEVAGASLNSDAVGASLRQILPRVRCRTEEVKRLDLRAGHVIYEGHDGYLHELPYDHVVVACGRAVNLATVPGMADHAFPLKTLGDALALRVHVMQQLEKAEACEDDERRRWLLSFVVVGGGFSGVETAGEINDLVRGSVRVFPRLSPEDVKVSLVHAGAQLLPEISEGLRDFARNQMEEAGIQVLCGARVGAATREGVCLLDGRLIPGATIVCTIGTTSLPLVDQMEAPKERGLLLTEPDMRLQGFENAWAIGDCARIVNAYDDAVSPPTGQFAERQGRQAAENVDCALRRQPPKPFFFKPLGTLCSIGGHRAVADFFGLRLSGGLAWFLWRSVYLAKHPSWARRVKVSFDWMWTILFGRDLLHLRPQQTDRVSRAYYQAGDYIIRAGEPATDFYIIEHGEVEVVRGNGHSSAPVLLAVLGPGDFFGEMALLEKRPRTSSVRARTAVQVTAMGREVFSQVSSSLAPLHDIVAAAVQRRRHSLWLDPVRAALAHEPVASLVEPLPAIHLRPDSTFEEALTAFRDGGLQSCYVLDENLVLQGIITRTDLLHAAELMATSTGGDQGPVRVREFMVVDPVAVVLDDSAALAAATMRDHKLKALPVVESHRHRALVGYVRIERILERLYLPAVPASAS